MKKIRLFLLMLMTALLPLASFGQEPLTVNDGTGSNGYIPLYGSYCDNGNFTQFIIPASDLAAMSGSTISKMVFYTTSDYSSISWGNAEFNCYLAEVDNTVFSSTSFVDWTSLTVVSTGSLSISDNQMEVNVEEFTYGGGNLLIGFAQTTAGTYKYVTWVGVSQSANTALYKYNYSSFSATLPATGSSQQFLPKVTFTYTAGTPSACPKPGILAVSNITATSATFNWSRGGSETSWVLEYTTADDTEWEWAESVTVNDTFKTIATLQEKTTYKARVYADCGSDGMSAARVLSGTFKTPCEAVTNLNEPFTDYEGTNYYTAGELPDCWETIYTGSSAGYAPHVYNVGTGYTDYAPHEGDNCLVINAGSSYGSTNYVILPVIDNLSTMQVSFVTGMYCSSSWDDYGKLTLGYMTGSTSATFHAIEEIGSTSYTSPASHEYILAGYDIPDGARLAFKWYDNTSYAYGTISCFIDDVVVDLAPACKKPANLACASNTARTATLSWKPLSGESSWTLEYSTEADLSDAISVMADDTFKLITGLTPNTTYYARVKANCSEENSDFGNPISFKTAYGIPFVETFETSTFPADWSRYSGKAADAFDGTLPTSTTSGWTSTTYGLGTYNYKMNIDGSYKYWLVTPNIDLSGATSVELNFDLAITDYNSNNAPGTGEPAADDEFMVIISTDNGATWSRSNATTWGTGADYDHVFATVSNTGTNYTISLDEYLGGTVKIAFYGASGSDDADFDVHVDNIYVQVPPTCYKPTNVTKDDVQARSAVIGWTDNNPGDEPTGNWLLVVNDTILVPADENPFTLTGLTPETRYTVNVQALCSGNDSSDVSTSSVTFTTLVSCPKPTNLTVVDTTVTSTSATFTWRPGRDEDTWFVRYGTGNTSTDTLVYDTVVTLTGLTPATTYMVKVRSFCDVADTSAWATASPLTTECEPYVVTNNIPFTENFNTLTSGIPTCWDNNEGTITSSYYKWGYYSSGNTGACVYFSASSTTGTNMLKTPVMDLTQVTDPKLSFYYKKNGSYDFSVYVSTDGGETYTTPLAEGLATASSWTQKTIALENLDSYDQVVIVFKGTGSYSYYSSYYYYYYLDDVEVGGIPTCNKPIAVSVPDSTLTANSAIVHWVDTNATAPENYTVSYTDGENTYTVTAQDTTVTLPNLAANTDYTVKVMSNCGTDGESAWTEEVSFSTPCELASAEGYAENFSGYSSISSSYYAYNGILPDCWDYIYTGTSTGYQPHLYKDSYYSPTANDTCVIMTAGGSSYGAENFAVMPGFESLAGKQMVFATAMESASYGTLTVGYVTSLTADAFTPMLTVPSNYYNGDNRYATHVVSLDTVPANARVAFRWAYNSSYYICCIDDIKIEDIPDCLPPTTVSVDTVTARTATLSWDNRNEEIPEGWTVEYTYNDTVTLTATCDTTFIKLENLVPETRYTVKVKANCSEISESAWSTPVNFTTTVTCFEPTNLTYSDVTDNSVILDWTTGRDGEEEWILVLNNEEILVNSHPLTIDTLRENTRYTVTVHALCTATDTSNASNTKTFTTACTPVSCEGYAENFNTGYAPTTSAISTTDNMPACWNYLVTNATGNYSRPHIYKGSSYSPTANDTCIIMPSNTTIGASYAIMLPLTDLNRKQIRFATAMSDAAGIFSLGYMTDIEDATTFTLIETVPTNLHNDATNRYAEHTLELVNIPDGARLAFKWDFNGSSTAKYACIDDIAIIDAPNCMKPTDLTVTNISAHEATFSWRENNTPDPENGWMLRISDGTTDVDTLVETNNFTFDQLAANTDYTVTVLTLCNVNDTSLWSVPATFSTPCEPLTANGYVENFNSYTGVSTTISDANGYLPACWDYIFTGSSAGYKPHMYKGTSYSPTSNDNCIIMTAGNSTYGNANYAIMPEMDTLTGKWMKFATAMDNANTGNLTVGYVTGLDASTFVMLDTIPNNYYYNTDTRYVLHEVFVNTVPAGARIAFKWAATTNYYYCCIDDIKIEDIPDCITPINVRVPEDSITGTTAKVYWTDRNTDEPASWTIMVNDTTVIANTNPFTLTDLTPSTLYTVKVRTNCNANDTSDWSDEVTFYTACGIRSAEGFSEDFTAYTASNYLSSSSGILPRCWDYIYTGESYYSSYRPHIYNGSYSPTANNNCIVMTAGIYEYYDYEYYDYDYYDYGLSNYVVLPEFESLAGKQLTFATAMNSSTYGMLSVGYVTSLSASTFTALDTVPNNYYYNDNTRYALHEVNVSTVPAGARIAFRWTGTDDYYYYCTIDDIVIEDIPTCLKPINVGVIDSTITQTSATIKWDDQNETAPANGWTILLNGTTEITATTNPFPLTGLTASTAYTVKVKANCSATDDSRYSDEITFHTECGTIVVTDENAFSEDFNDLTSGIPVCWDNSEGTTTDNSYKWNYSSSGATGACVRFNSYTNSSANTNMLKTPVLDLTQMTAIPQLSFKYKYPGYTYSSTVVGNFSVFVSTDGGNTYTTAVLSEGHVDSWMDTTISLENLAAYDQVVIVFKGTSDCGYTDDYIYLDDVVVGPGRIPCAAPTNVTVDSNYVVRWEGNAPRYNVMVMVGNDTVATGTSTTGIYSITSGLNDGDQAIVYVQAICAPDDLSAWTASEPFTYHGVGIENYAIHANVFPNPTTGNVTVESNAIGADLNVYDMFGKLMMTTTVASERTELDFSGFAPGVYVVRIANSTAVTTVKVVKK